MSIADAKRALQACEQGVSEMIAQQKSNQVLVDDYNNRLKAWEAKRDAAAVIYKNWENKSDSYSKYKNLDANQEFDSHDTDWSRDCSVCWSACNYPSSSGWADTNCQNWARERNLVHSNEYYYNGNYRHDSDGGDGACGKKKVRYKCSRRPSAINEWVASYNAARPVFTEKEPLKPAQNQTPISLACCANTLNIVGSDVNETYINQQNNCLSDKKREIQDAEKAAEAEKAMEAVKAAEAEKAAEAVKAVEAVKAAEAVKAIEAVKAAEAVKSAEAVKAANQKILLIIAIILISLCLLSSSLASIMMML